MLETRPARGPLPMFHDDTLPAETISDALESALSTVCGVFERPDQLLGANVEQFENLAEIVFAYFGRDDVFYVNKAGRRLLRPKSSALDALKPSPPPIFWLDEDRSFRFADRRVLESACPLFDARELVALSWGKTWLRGVKLPLLSRKGAPIALLFAGLEIPGSEQIRQVANQYKSIAAPTGIN